MAKKSSPSLGPGVRRGDARELLTHFSGYSGRFSAIVTSPPYWDLQDYDIAGQIGFGQSTEEYLKDLRMVFEACTELTTDKATMWLVVGAIRRLGEVVPLPGLVTEQARAAGWRVREIVTWEKSKSLPFTKHGEFRDVTEQAILLSKTRDYLFDMAPLLVPEPQTIWWLRYPERYSPEGTKPTNIWSISIPTQGAWKSGPNHSCPFPHELTYRMLSVVTREGDLVLDPFAGIGSVPALANAMGRRGYGLELSARFIEQYSKAETDARIWWSKKEQAINVAAERRTILRGTILQLRALKFARLVAAELTKAKQAPRWIRVGNCSNGSLARHKLVAVSYEIVLDDPFSADLVLEVARQAAERRPLSKFGIEARFEVVRTSEARLNGIWFPSGKFWRSGTTSVPNGDAMHLVASIAPRTEVVAAWGGGAK